MEAVSIVLRPKLHITATQDFHAKDIDILLTESTRPNTGKTQKQLPTTSILFDDEPAEALCNFVYDITGEQLGGLKGKRAVFVPPTSTEPIGDQESFVKGALYCIPVDSKDKLNGELLENLPGSPGFYSLDLVLERLNDTNPLAFSKQAKVMLIRLDSWLREKHSVPGAMDLLFSVCTEDRLKRSITNPAYLTDSQSGLSSSHLEDEYSRTIANEALAKMMAIEKCDLTVINPLFGSDMSYKAKVVAVAVNKFWGLGKPDYSKILSGTHYRAPHSSSGDYNWMEEFPMHKCAHIGDAEGIRELIKKGVPVSSQDRDSWAPIHYAVWFGHIEAITVLLNEGECSPNIKNNHNSSPLHLAASQGHVYVVELLLNHQEIDVHAMDINGKTAINLCENIDKRDSQACTKLLSSAVKKPPPTIQVSLMDGTYRGLNLVSGANTTIQQLHTQMMTELNMPDSCGHLFTIWICSRNLQLQLKPDHKPIQHLNDWKRKIVAMLTNHEPSREDPQLFWRRDAILCIVEERKVKHPVAVSLLFHEAYHNYIKTMYPCAEHDAIILAGILMQLNQGDFDARRTKNYLASSALNTLIPQTKLRGNKKIDWASKIQAQYKSYSQSMGKRDRSPQVLQQHFLQICWNLTVYGSAFFTGFVQIKTSRVPTAVYIGVNDIGIHVINAGTKVMLQSFNYKDIEWSHKETPVLEIKLVGSSKGGMHILTKQALLVELLMNTLHHLRDERVKLCELKKQIRVQDAMVRQQQAMKEQRLKKDDDKMEFESPKRNDVEVMPRAKLREWHHRLKQLKQHVHQQQEEGIDMVPSFKTRQTERFSPALAMSDSSGNLDEFFNSVSENFDHCSRDFGSPVVDGQLEEDTMAIASDNQSELYGDGSTVEYLYLQDNVFMKGDNASWN